MTHGTQVHVVLPAAYEHGPYFGIGGVGDIDAAVVEHQQAMLEQAAHLVHLFGFAHHHAAATHIGGNPPGKPRMHKRHILPLVFVRGDDQHASAKHERRPYELSDYRCLACARLSNKHRLKYFPCFLLVAGI